MPAKTIPSTAARPAAKPKAGTARPVVKFRIRITAGDVIAVGPGKVALPAVDSAKGGQHDGGGIVTAEGRKLITLYRRIETDAAKSCQADIKGLTAMLAR